MTSKRIFITGASGCIGHYVVDKLIQDTEHELFLLVRDPQKLRLNLTTRAGIHLLQGDMLHIERHRQLLKTVDYAVLIATAWGGPNTHDINVTKTIRLLNLLDPDVCQQVVYFSTASILGRDNQPLRQAGEVGTDYVRTKYDCHQRVQKLAIAPRVTTLFPTLVFGGDATKPLSQISSGLPQVVRWIDLIRFLKADGGFHYIHCEDIAKVVLLLLHRSPTEGKSRQLVLGNAPLTVNEAIEEISGYLGRRIYFRIPLTAGLANFFIRVFRIQMAAWDRFCMDYRYFTYEQFVNPTTYGSVPYCATLSDVFKVSGIAPRG